MIRLLIVDDEPETREAILEMIEWEKNGIVVCGQASNGKDAVLQLQLLQPDVLLLDICMPVLDGLAVTKYIHENGLPIKIILLSGHDEFQYAQQALRLGAADCLLKPCRPEDILESIHRCTGAAPAPHTPAEEEPNPQAGGLIGAAMRYIDQHYAQELDLATVASHIYITPTYLSLLFKQGTKVNFVDYLNKVRIKKACLLMGDLNLKVYEIAAMVGYRDERYFARVFKKLTGKNPTEYRHERLHLLP